MKTFKDILEDVYTSEYKEKQFVGQDGKTHTRKIRPSRIEFKNSKANAEPAKKDEMQEQVEFRIDHRDKATGDHKSTFADHEAKVSDTTDKATYVKVPSHKADSFKSAMKSKHGVKVELAEGIDKEHPIVKEYDSLKKNHDIKSLRGLVKSQHRIIDTSEFKTKDHAISHYLRTKHGDKKVDAAFGLKEAHKLGDTVVMTKGPKDVVGKTGQVGEIRTAAGGAKTYTIDHDKGSVQLKSTHFKKPSEDKMKTFKNHITHNMPTTEEVEQTIEQELHEVLSKDAKAADWIADFVKSDNPKFAGKSKKERVQMALGAYYGKHNEEVLDELSKSTLGAYVKKSSRERGFSGLEAGASGSGTRDQKNAVNTMKKRQAGVIKAVDRLTKEEAELQEARVNGREYASHGLMHPDHAKMDIHKVSGQHVDFYASKTGDKMQGKVTKNDGKSVHIQAHKDKELGDGKLHKFKVTPHLPKQNNEEFENGELETTMKSYKEFMESLDEALWPGTPEYNKKFGGGADRSKGAETSTTHGKAIGTGTGVKHERDYEKAEKETPAAASTEKRGRGRPAGSTSGARQKGTIAKSEYAGADYTGHKLHLPNSNR